MFFTGPANVTDHLRDSLIVSVSYIASLFIMATHCNGQAIIFLPCGFFYLLSFFLA